MGAYVRTWWFIVYCSGGGEDEPIDLLAEPGQRVGFFISRNYHGTNLSQGVPLWMRSDDMSVTSDGVLDSYYEQLGSWELAPDRAVDRRMVVVGQDAYGRRLVDFQLLMDDGRVLRYDKIFRMTHGRHWKG